MTPPYRPPATSHAPMILQPEVTNALGIESDLDEIGIARQIAELAELPMPRTEAGVRVLRQIPVCAQWLFRAHPRKESLDSGAVARYVMACVSQMILAADWEAALEDFGHPDLFERLEAFAGSTLAFQLHHHGFVTLTDGEMDPREGRPG